MLRRRHRPARSDGSRATPPDAWPVVTPAGHRAGVAAARRTIVTALALQPEARERLARLLDARVVDVREQCDRPDLVLAPACSPQLISGLRRIYRAARIVVVEIHDSELGAGSAGPVRRLLSAGADAYLLADTVDELAAALSPSFPAEDAILAVVPLRPVPTAVRRRA